MRWLTLIHRLTIAVVSVLLAPFFTSAEVPTPARFDCGTQSLYNLLRIEGRSVDLPRIERSLPPPLPEGYSMSELKAAARALGLNLSGVRLAQRDDAIDRPMVAFFRHDGHGHFLTIRPLGHTGKLVQVLDPGKLPFVTDKAELFASPGWTGLALVLERTPWMLRGSAAVLLILTISIYLRRRKRKPEGNFPHRVSARGQ